MLNYEASLRQRFLEGRLEAGVAFYFINGRDMIQTVRQDGRPLNVNTGCFINKGFELDAAYRIDRRWNVAANYAYLHTDNAGLLAAPKNRLNAMVDFMPGRFSFALSSNTVWSLRNGGPKTVDYELLNLRAAYTFHKPGVHVTPFLKLDNITDRRYEVVYGCPMPGITILGGVEATF